ncbi:MAG: hypothetical protein QXT77_08170 [Candidatus Methanomethylicaceae archaeon]
MEKAQAKGWEFGLKVARSVTLVVSQNTLGMRESVFLYYLISSLTISSGEPLGQIKESHRIKDDKLRLFALKFALDNIRNY